MRSTELSLEVKVNALRVILVHKSLSGNISQTGESVVGERRKRDRMRYKVLIWVIGKKKKNLVLPVPTNFLVSPVNHKVILSSLYFLIL